jgi:hypothetical protein
MQIHPHEVKILQIHNARPEFVKKYYGYWDYICVCLTLTELETVANDNDSCSIPEEEEEEKIRLKKYVSLRSKGRHN